MEATFKAKSKWDRIAPIYDLITWFETKGKSAATRRSLFEGKVGLILEVGIGTGHNIKFYPEAAKVVGVDLSHKMLKRAAQKAKASGSAVWLVCADAERLPFKDSSFDSAASTCVFCSIPDPVAAFREVARVLKPGRTFSMYEHVISKIKPLALLMQLLNPIVAKLFGPNINRDTLANAGEAGLEIAHQENVRLFDIFKRIDAVRNPGLVQP